MFGNNTGYHDEQRGSFVDKTSAMAKFAGIATAALTAAPLFSRLSGRAGRTLAHALADDASLTRRIFGSAGNVDTPAAVLDDAVNFLTEGVPKMQHILASHKIHHQRLSSFIDSLEAEATPETVDLFRSLRPKITAGLKEVGSGREIQGLMDSLLSDSGLKRFAESAPGVRFRFMDGETMANLTPDRLAKAKRAMGSMARQAQNLEINANLIHQVFEGDAGEANKRLVYEVLERGMRTRGQVSAMRSRAMGHQAGVRHLTGADLFDDALAPKIERYLYNTGLPPYHRKGLTGPDQEFTGVASLRRSVMEPLQNLFGKTSADGSVDLGQEGTALLEQFKQLQTGLVMEGDQVYSIAHARNAMRNAGQQALKHSQIPLVPGLFNVPGTIGQFLLPDNAPVRNLGNITRQGELSRLGLAQGMGQYTQGLGVGNELMAFDPETNALTLLGHEGGSRFLFFDNQKSNHLRNWAAARARDVESEWQALQNADEGLVRGLVEKVAAGDEEAHSALTKLLYANEDKFFDLGFDQNTGLYLSPKKGGLLGSLVHKKLFGSNPARTTDQVDPRTLIRFALDNFEELNRTNPDSLRDFLARPFLEAAQARGDQSATLKSAAKAIREGRIQVDLDDTYASRFMRMLDVSDDPTALLREMQNPLRVGAEDVSLFEQFSELSHTATRDFYEAVTSIGDRPDRLFEIGRSEGGFLNDLSKNTLGEAGLSRAHQRLQEGMLAEIAAGMGRARFRAEFGGEAELAHIARQLGGSQSPQGPLAEFMRSLGLDDTGMSKFIAAVSETDPEEGFRIVERSLGPLYASMAVHPGQNASWSGIQTIAEIAQNPFDKVKALNALRRDVDALGFYADDPSITNRLVRDMAEHGELAEALIQRFKTGRQPWHPLEGLVDPQGDEAFTAIPSSASSLMEEMAAGRGMIDALLGQAQRGFGVGDFLSSAVDPNAPMGHLGMAFNMLMFMPQEIGKIVGLGLPAADSITPLRGLAGFTLKRVGPVFLGWEAYKNVNANLHAAGLPGIDDAAANVLANFGLSTASLKDSLGLTGLNQDLVYGIPGLDQYFTPRDREEYEDYLFYGDEMVREGRGWFVGNRNNLMGADVKYARPNFYRRWRGHWTEAENVRLAAPEYSWLPNLQNPLAPVSRLLNPNWWEEEMGANRPYLTDAEAAAFARGDRAETVIHAAAGMGGANIGFGSFGGGLPTTMYGAEAQGGGAVGGVGGGAGGGTGPGAGPGEGGGGFGVGEAYYTPGYETIRVSNRKDIPVEALRERSFYNEGVGAAEKLRHHMGLYGAFVKMLPFQPEPTGAIDIQDSDKATSFGRQTTMLEWGEALGPFGEFYRRFIHKDNQGYDAFNPLPNDMPDWLPQRFQTGDPYMRLPGIGELQLPGDAYERTHPWVTPMRVRGSMLGLEEHELMAKLLDPLTGGPMDERGERITDFGTRAHKVMMRAMEERGLLVSGEIHAYDPAHNVSATIETIVKNAQGEMEVVEIKTRGPHNMDTTPEKYLDQAMYYSHMIGAKKGHILHVNREDPTQMRLETFDVDPERIQAIQERIARVRGQIQELVDRGEVSPFQTYDLLARIEVLAKVAPESAEFRMYVKAAEEKGGFGGEEQRRYENALETAELLRKDYNLYPRRANVPTDTRSLLVEGVTDDGEIITPAGVFSLAGLRWDRQAFAYEDPAEVLAQAGIHVGSAAPVTLIAGQFDGTLSQDTTLQAIVGDANRTLIDRGYAHEDIEDRHPLASRVVRGNNPTLGLLEGLVHSDNMLTNKLLRVRTALEQFERGEVFGTDDSKWDDLWGNYGEPTINSFIAKDPLTGGIQSAIAASLFVRSAKAKGRVAGAAGILGALASIGRSIFEDGDGPWTPKRYRRRAEFDEYYDILEFVKESSLAESAKREARAVEGVDVDMLQDSSERMRVGIGPYTALAVNAERRASRTMYGFDVASGTLQEALAAVPRRQRQIAEEVILSGTPEEKGRFYELLPDAQKRVLGKFLGKKVEELPERPSLSKYFESHFLPDSDWLGWSPEVDLDDIQARGAELEGIKIDRPSRQRLAKARAYTRNVQVPRMDSPTYRHIRGSIERMISDGSFGNVRVQFGIQPAINPVVSVRMDLQEDHTDALAHELREDVRRS